MNHQGLDLPGSLGIGLLLILSLIMLVLALIGLAGSFNKHSPIGVKRKRMDPDEWTGYVDED